MLHKRSSLGTRKVSPPQPTCMTAERKASYLADLRNNRPVRPAGSRPLPGRPQVAFAENDLPSRTGSALSMRRHFENLSHDETERHPTLSKRASMPLSNTMPSSGSNKGRPLAAPPNTITEGGRRRVSPSLSLDEHEMQYKDLSARKWERQEAHQLREALEMIDQKDEEQRVYDAAKLEAADLVWKHMNPEQAETEKTAAYRNPDLNKKSYGSISHAKSTSTASRTTSNEQQRNVSGESTGSQGSKRTRLPWLRRRSKIGSQDISEKYSVSFSHPTRDGDEITALPQPKARRTSSGGRKVSSGSSKGIFRNPEDQIYEEPESLTTNARPSKKELPLTDRSRNSLPRGSRPLPWKPSIKSERDTQAREQSDFITLLPEATEIRGEDIRAATSMKRKDRSPNLPTPTAVSDRMGRPIVSFDPKWRTSNDSPRKSEDHERPYTNSVKPSAPKITIQEDSTKLSDGRPRHAVVDNHTTDIPSISVSPMPPVPTICVPDESQVPSINIQPDIPSISLPDEDQPSFSVPSINIPGDESSTTMPQAHATQPRPLPQPSRSAQRSSNTKKPSMTSRVPWLSRDPMSATSGSTVSCTACGLPISGRIVTAAGSAKSAQKARFHPQCFTCHHCSTPLECVSFYPEPETARLERFQVMLSHLSPEDEQIHNLAKSNEDLRFYCHLDFHELHSPRCHSCKTPIEGAVVLALGRQYHPDHFFCAECGDPFNSDSPFVEHNKYAYCVSCHTKRTSARCRACKKQILDEMTVEAMGGKWHDECFVCDECGGDFGDDGRFFVREVDVQPTEKEKRKGISRKVEERAVCQGCEELRVKNVDMFI